MSILLPAVAGSLLGLMYTRKNKTASETRDNNIDPPNNISSTKQFLLQRPKVNAELSAISGWGLNTRVRPHPGSMPHFNRTFAEETEARAAQYYSRYAVGYIPIHERGYQPAERTSLA